MKDSKFKHRESEEKFEKYKTEIQNERNFAFRINTLFSLELEDQLEDILIIDQNQFFNQIKNRVEAELEETFSEKIFLEQKFTSLIEKGLNSIKSDYNQNFRTLNNTYETYIKNKNFKNDKIKYLTSGYRRHCINEVNNEFATHTCNAKLGKFILVEKNGKIDFVICSNCKKVYYDTMISCKCYKCNIEYYTEILPNNENEYLLPATWDNYHCKQITKEKMKCIKCRDNLYLNLKTNTLICHNKNCNFSSNPNKILWTCSICNQDFKSGAIPYNPLDLEIIKKVIKQTLYLKQYAHPNKVPCCKVNVFFSEFYHKKKCDGVLYTGELNHELIIVCEKCHAVNFYERFIWTCPKCGNKFRDDNKNNNLSDEKSDKDNIDEDISSNSNNSKNRNHKESYHSNKMKEISDFNLDKNNKSEKIDIQKNNSNYNNKDNDIDKDDPSIKKTKSSRFKRKLNNIYYEREKEKKEKEKDIIESNYRTEYNNNNQEDTKPIAIDINNKRKRSRFYSNFATNYNEKEKEKEKEKEENSDNEKRKIEKTPLNIFSRFRRNRKVTEAEQEPKEKKESKEKEIKIIRVNKKEEKNNNDEKDKKTEVIKINYPKSNKIIPYRSFKRNTNYNLKEQSNALNKLLNEKKDEEKEKEKEKIPEPRRERRRFLSHLEKGNDINKIKDKDKEKENDNDKEKDKIINEKFEDEEEIESEDLNTKKRNRIVIEQKQETKKEEANSNYENKWKFRHPEPKKTLGKEIKEENQPTSPTSISNNATKDKTKSSNSNEENNNSQSPEKSTDTNKDSNDNKKKNVKMSKIPGMSESLYNHVMKRISNITSKCTIPMMNIEDYTLVKKIGEGSYGIIFKAIGKKDNKEFALKKIISNKLQKIGEFIKEFELVYSCHHENIMKIYSYCIRILDSTTYALYVLMELSDGDWDIEIKSRLMQRKNYTEKELINILFQISSALLYIEQNFHISHRDIKPQNVLVFPGGKYKMADFGEAKETKVMRQRNTLRGTELYMSPALYNGLKHEMNDVSHNPFKSDVFSLGFCFLYAAALNFNLLYQVRDIFDNKNINLVLHQFLGKFYSEKFISLIASMLEMDESKRYDFIDINKYIEKNFEDMIK